jgi:invasion protein IalB
VADQSLFKGNLLPIIGGVVLVALVGVAAFLAGQRYAPTSVAPSATGPGAATARERFVRLPPQKFESWVLNCIRGPRGGQRCGLSLSVVDQSRTHLMFRLDVLRSAKGPAMVVVAPPSTLLTAGFTVTPEKAQPVTMPFTRCMPRACEALYILSDAFKQGLSAASTARIHFVMGNGRPVDLQIPVKGFQAGYAALQTQDTAVASAAPATVHADQAPNGAQNANPSPGN